MQCKNTTLKVELSILWRRNKSKKCIKNERYRTVVLPLLPHIHNPSGMFYDYKYNTVLCICTLVLDSLLQDESMIQILEDVSSCILAMDFLMN